MIDPTHCFVCDNRLKLGQNWTQYMADTGRDVCRKCEAERHRAYNARYRARNRSKAVERTRQWRIDNPEKYAAIQARRKERDRLGINTLNDQGKS